jgi:predicted regulator of Ras-like GTPase activity (Roadblock/LC7/MglB family)
MSVKIPEAVQQQLADILHAMEETSELTRCVVVTRTGIKIAPDMDADSYSASSAALIDLGERVVASLEHGTLEELVINAIGGYVILAAVGKEYMLLGATSAGLKMGYYLPYVRKKAWDLENIIYGAKGAGTAAEGTAPKTRGQGVSRPVAQAPPVPEEKVAAKVTVADIKAMDMRAMNDVLAAFDEFGINDDFTKSLGDEAVPTVNISQEEMSAISQQKTGQEPVVPEIVPEVVPAPTVQKAPVAGAQKAPAAATQKAQVGICPIPLEPGEVPPIALSSEELVTDGEVAATPQQAAPTSVAPEVAPSPPVKAPVAAVAAAKPAVPQQPATAKAAPAASAAPSFDNASEYDFEFDGTTQPEKEVVVPEQDSMSDTLKALGWEEEEDK